MPPVVPDPKRIRSFEDAQAFERWLAQNHAKEPEIFLRIGKKDSGFTTVSHAEALQIALCWGWIDAIRKSYDEKSFLQRFTPRKAKSVWSQINCQHVERLIAEKRMTEHGLKHVLAAKADGRWDAAYAPSSKLIVPEDLLTAVRADPRAFATFEKLDKQNLFALVYRLGRLKTAEGRARKIESFVATLRGGRGLIPARSSAKESAPSAPEAASTAKTKGQATPRRMGKAARTK